MKNDNLKKYIPSAEYLIVISGRTRNSVLKNIQNAYDFIQNEAELELKDFSIRLLSTYRRLDFEFVVIVNSFEELEKKMLSALSSNRHISSYLKDKKCAVLLPNKENLEVSFESFYLNKSNAKKRWLMNMAAEGLDEYLSNCFSYLDMLHNLSIQPNLFFGLEEANVILEHFESALSEETLLNALYREAKRLTLQDLEEKIQKLFFILNQQTIDSLIIFAPNEELKNCILNNSKRYQDIEIHIISNQKLLLESLSYVEKHCQSIIPNKAFSRKFKRLHLPNYEFDDERYLVRKSNYMLGGSASMQSEIFKTKDVKEAKFTLEQILFEMGAKVIDEEMTISDLNFTSLEIMQVVAKISKEFGERIPLNLFYENKPLVQIFDDIIDFFESNYIQTKGFISLNEVVEPRGTMIAFPPALGYGLFYSNIVEFFTDFNFYSFDFSNEVDIIDYYTKQVMNNISISGPIYILGFSAGGTLGFEVAKNLEENGMKITKLLMVDSTYKVETGNVDIVEVEEALATEMESLFLRHDNELKETLDVYKKGAVSHIMNYHNIVNSGSVASPITYFYAYNNDQRELWEQSSRDNVEYVLLEGSHNEIFSEEHWEDNCNAIRKNIVLEEEYSSELN